MAKKKKLVEEPKKEEPQKVEEPRVTEEPRVAEEPRVVEEPKKVLIDIADLEEFKKELAEVKKQNSMLLEVADKRGVERYLEKHKGEKKTEVRVRSIDGKIVVGWEKMKSNDVYRDMSTLAWRENQVVTLLFEGGAKQEYNFVDFNRRFEYVYCVLVGRVKDDITGEEILKLISNVDGKELTINSKFVN